MVVRAGVAKGARVLINGATGGIGSALLQICVDLGTTVTAVGNTKNLQLLKSLGATRVVDYEHTDFTQDEHTYDFVFDAVGMSTFGACKRLLEPQGVYASSELCGGRVRRLPRLRQARGGLPRARVSAMQALDARCL